MKISNYVARLSMILLTVLIIAGCSSTNPAVTLSDIPILPDLTIYEGAEETTFDTLISALQQAFEVQAAKIEVQYYWMPETVTWEQVEQFYQMVFADTNWTAVKAGETFNTACWTRKSRAGKQVLVISAVPIVSSAEHILVLILVLP